MEDCFNAFSCTTAPNFLRPIHIYYEWALICQVPGTKSMRCENLAGECLFNTLQVSVNHVSYLLHTQMTPSP